MNASERAKIIRQHLADEFGQRLRGVVLYGSEARGESEPYSDIDVLVLLEGPVEYGRDLRRAIAAVYPLVLEWERPISVEPVQADEYDKQEWPLYRNARREGVAV